MCSTTRSLGPAPRTWTRVQARADSKHTRRCIRLRRRLQLKTPRHRRAPPTVPSCPKSPGVLVRNGSTRQAITHDGCDRCVLLTHCSYLWCKSSSDQITSRCGHRVKMCPRRRIHAGYRYCGPGCRSRTWQTREIRGQTKRSAIIVFPCQLKALQTLKKEWGQSCGTKRKTLFSVPIPLLFPTQSCSCVSYGPPLCVAGSLRL